MSNAAAIGWALLLFGILVVVTASLLFAFKGCGRKRPVSGTPGEEESIVQSAEERLEPDGIVPGTFPGSLGTSGLAENALLIEERVHVCLLYTSPSPRD